MSRTAYAIRHVPFEDLGSLAPALVEHGLQVRYVEAGLDDIAAVQVGPDDVLVILGGPIGADQDDLYPFLRDELRLVERTLARGRPLLGICLGAQLLARALGSRVFRAPRPELGWAPIELTAAGRGSVLAPLHEHAVFHWHGDTFELPAGSRHLASTPSCAHQAFAIDPCTLGVQFHPEVRPRELERWYIGHAHELGTADVGVAQLRRDASVHGPSLVDAAARVWDRWLAAVAQLGAGTPREP